MDDKHHVKLTNDGYIDLNIKPSKFDTIKYKEWVKKLKNARPLPERIKRLLEEYLKCVYNECK